MSSLDWAELAVVCARLDRLLGTRPQKRDSANDLRQWQKDLSDTEAEREQILGRLFDALPQVVGAAA
ncbi:MAG: hypothetical protein JO305_04660 [Alphaproteobacteria bacterium]|nr:hypothetical protein [Alphaproteobacteria bacterium]